MRVWLITVGEPLPTDPGNVRLMRTGIVADMLSARGHDVLWWTSTMNHKQKSNRFDRDTTLEIQERYRIKLLHGTEYRRNISFQRIANHVTVARRFREAVRREAVPDVILCSLPTLELSQEATLYGKRHGIPVILDIRDLWPDIFVEMAPRWGRGIAKTLLAPLYRSAHRSCARAAAITGITSEIVDWGLQSARRAGQPSDRDFPLAYMQKAPGQAEQDKALAFWREQGIVAESKPFVACFFGTLGNQFEIDTVIDAGLRLRQDTRDIRFVICGSGDQFARYKDQAANCPNILFPGWVGAPEIWTLMRMASVGLAPYINRFDFLASLPNKSIEYLSAGLPVVTSLRTGVLNDLLEKEHCGFAYQDSDDLQTLLRDLYDHRERLCAAAENARNVYERRFVGERVYSDMCDYLEAAALQAGARPAVRPERNIRRRDSNETRV